MTSIPLVGRDTIDWGTEPMGTCSFKAIYHSLQPLPIGPQLLWEKHWNLPIPSKTKFFGWKLLQGHLPTAAYVSHFLQSISPECVCCRTSDENIDHLFLHCEFSMSVAQITPLTFPAQLSIMTSHPGPGSQAMCLIVIWYIWKSRNY